MLGADNVRLGVSVYIYYIARYFLNIRGGAMHYIRPHIVVMNLTADSVYRIRYHKNMSFTVSIGSWLIIFVT